MAPADAATEESGPPPALDERDEHEARERGAGPPDVEPGDRDGDDEGAVAGDEPRPAPSARPWGRIAAVISLVYVAWYVVGLVVLQRSAGTYNALNRFYGGLVPRVVLCGVLLAVLYHLLDGVRATAQDALPRLAGHEVLLRATVRFLLLAVWIPASVVVLWPAIRTWFSR